MKSLYLVAALALSFLSGCAQMSPNFNEMTAAYSATVDEHDRNSLLVNLLRASNKLPIQFTTIPSVIGTGTVTSAVGIGANLYSVDPASVGGFFSAAAGSSSSLSSSLGAQRQFSFTLSTLDNALFTKGFLSDIAIDRLHLLATSGQTSMDLLYTLVVSSIEVNPQLKKDIVFQNDMVDNHYSRFKARMEFLIDAGLTTELSDASNPVGLPMTRQEVVAMTTELTKTNPDVFSTYHFYPVAGVKNRYQVYETHSNLRYCLSLPQSAKNVESIFSQNVHCTSDAIQENFQVPDIGLLQTFENEPIPLEDVKKLSFILHLRSTRDVFRYLGQIIQFQMKEGGKAPPISVRSVDSSGIARDLPLLIVHKGSPPIGVQVIARANYFNENYYIAKEGSGLSAEVIDLLSVLVTLNKIPGSVPASPGILIR